MPRYTNEVGVVVDIPADLAERLGGYTPVGGGDGGLDPAALAAWLDAEDWYRADVAEWLDAEQSYVADVKAWLDAETAANKSAGAARGRK